MKITRTSVLTKIKRTKDIDLDIEDFSRWKLGTPIEEAMPYLSIDDRDFIVSGIISGEWESLFKEETIENEENYFI